MSNTPYTYNPVQQQGGYHDGGSNAVGLTQEGSIPYPPMPEGYQQYAAPPLPVPGSQGYVAGPQYAMQPYTYVPHAPSSGQQQPQQHPHIYNANFVNPAHTPNTPLAPLTQPPPEAPAATPEAQTAPPPPPSVFDADPAVVKRTAYYTPSDIAYPTKTAQYNGGDLNTPIGNGEAPPPVVGYILTIPFNQESPVIGIPVQQACCRHCNQSQYTGRVVDHSKKHTSAISLSGFGPEPGMCSIDGELFRPCLCPSYIHRGCFRESRAGMSFLKTRDYYECRHCKFTYKLERIMGGAKPLKNETAAAPPEAMVSPNPTAMGTALPPPLPAGPDGFVDQRYSFAEDISEGNVRTRFFIKVALMWLITIIVLAIVIGALTGASYGLDKENKRIPVFIKMMFYGVTSMDVEKWREEFKRPDVRVWYYYLGFAVFLSALGIIFFGLISYLCCVNTDDSEIRPSLCGYICGDDAGREREISDYLFARQSQQRQYNQQLPPAVQAAVVQRQERRSNEVRDHYYRQRQASYWFSCADNSSYYYYDSRPYYYRRRANYYDNRYNGNGRHYYNGGYYAGGDEACCDTCICCIVCCCTPSDNYHHHHRYYYDSQYGTHAHMGGTAAATSSSSSSGTCNCNSSDCNCGNCLDCGDCRGCDCGNCSGDCGDCGKCDCGDCKCSGGNCDGGGEGAIAVLLVVLLVVIVLIIVSAYVTLVSYLISRSIRLMGVASKLAYIQALEQEDHVFALGINESWRPVGAI